MISTSKSQLRCIEKLPQIWWPVKSLPSISTVVNERNRLKLDNCLPIHVKYLVKALPERLS